MGARVDVYVCICTTWQLLLFRLFLEHSPDAKRASTPIFVDFRYFSPIVRTYATDMSHYVLASRTHSDANLERNYAMRKFPLSSAVRPGISRERLKRDTRSKAWQEKNEKVYLYICRCGLILHSHFRPASWMPSSSSTRCKQNIITTQPATG